MRHFVLSGAIPLAAAMVILWSLAPTSYAAQCFWQHDPNTPGDWFGPGNWDPSAPQAEDGAFIENGGTASIAGGSVRVWYLKVGGAHNGGSVIQCGGTNTVETAAYVGWYWGQTGSYDLSEGLLEVQGTYMWVGFSGTGRFNQSGGTTTVGGFLILGYDIAGTGSYVLSGGSLAASMLVGDRGKGSFVQTGGTTTAPTLTVAGSGGSYQLSAGSLASERQYVGYDGGATFTQSGGLNAVSGSLRLTQGRGTYNLTGGMLDVRGGVIRLGPGGGHSFDATGGTLLAGKMSVGEGMVKIATGAAVTLGNLELADLTTAVTTLSFELGRTGSAFISGIGGTGSPVTIGAKGNHTLDLQTGAYRPREGDAFCVLTNFGSITGSFDHVTTNITLGQQNDPNTGLPMPFFAAGVVSDPNDPSKVAMQVTFQGLTAGDANGDHAVDGGDLALIGGAWMKSGQDWATCDFNGDGQVDACDLALFGGNWGWTLPPAPLPGAPLPEPASAGLLLAGGLALIGARRRIHPVG